MALSARRILIINGKGGCGKTTIATNLAVAYSHAKVAPEDARSGQAHYRVALIDNDPQGSSTYWHSLRQAERSAVSLVTAHQRAGMYQTQAFAHRILPETDRIIVDGQSNARDADLDTLLRQSDVILIPVLPSAIDMRASQIFIDKLLSHRLFKSAPRPVGVIANRVHCNGEAYGKLQSFIAELDVPLVATLRDTPAYTTAVEQGLGLIDEAECRGARKELPTWHAIVRWIESQPRSERQSVAALRSGPKLHARLGKLQGAEA